MIERGKKRMRSGSGHWRTLTIGESPRFLPDGTRSIGTARSRRSQRGGTGNELDLDHVAGTLAAMDGYGQYCPIARGAEIFATRWTPIIIRNLLVGCCTFSQIR